MSHGKQVFVLHDRTRFETVSYGLPLDSDEFNSLLTDEHKFELLIELITETIEPESWPKDVDLKLDLEIGSGQVVISDGGKPR